MPEEVASFGRIGPNAILQLEDPLERLVGPGALQDLLSASHVAMPTGDDMIAEEDVRVVQLTLCAMFPGRAASVRNLSGTATGAYIRAHRIPATAALMLRLLPTFVAERILTRAIVCHAWTFCGSGSVAARRVSGGVEISISDNPLVDRASQRQLQCDWHEAVFRDLYATLLRRDYHVSETSCCGAGAPACRFLIRRR